MKHVKKTKIASLVVWGALGIWGLNACQKEETSLINDVGQSKTSSYYASQTDDTKKQLSLRLSKLLALSMTDVRVRRLIKSEVLKRRDGDYNVLFAEIKNIPFPSSSGESPEGNTLAQVLERKSNMTHEQWVEFLNRMEEIFPLAQIAVPRIHAATPENWNIAAHIPAVACHDLTGSSAIIPGFNASGEVIQFNAFEAPDRLTAVVSENERLILVAKDEINKYSDLTLFFESKKYFFYSKELVTDFISMQTLVDRGIGTIEPGDGDFEVDCDGNDGDRLTNKDKDNYNKFKFTSVNNAKGAEPWTSGDFEMRVVIVIADAEAGELWSIEKFTKANRTDVINCNVFGESCDLFYFNVDAEVVTWDPEEMGLQMKYEFIEEDNGATVNISISANLGITDDASVNGSVSVSIPNEHDRLGSSLVEYCDNTDGEGTLYNTGSLYFYVNQ